MVEEMQSGKGTVIHDRRAGSEATAAKVVFSFLKALAINLEKIRSETATETCHSLFQDLYKHLATDIPKLDEALDDSRVRASFRVPTQKSAPVATTPHVPIQGSVRRLPSPLSVLRRCIHVLRRPGSEGPQFLRDAKERWRNFRAGPSPAVAGFTGTNGITVLNALAQLSDDDLRTLAEVIVEHHRASIDKAALFIDDIHSVSDARKSVIFLTVGFPTTWAPLVEELTRTGIPTCAVCLFDYTGSLETGVLNTAEIPVRKAWVLDFLGHLMVLAASGPSSVLLNTDGYYCANWDATRATVLYMLIEAMIEGARSAKAGKSDLVALKYDAVQPVRASETATEEVNSLHALLGDFYRRSMSKFDCVVYNSNSELMGVFNEKSIPLPIPRLHFYRYAQQPKRAVAKPDWEEGSNIHLVMLSLFLPDSGDDTRNNHAKIVAGILHQKLHVHYYCDPSHRVVKSFVDSLDAEDRAFFHPHAVIRDQQELVEEVQRYHVGLALADNTPFLESISGLTDSFYRDATSALQQSSVPSALFVFAAAGLPFIYPSFSLGIQEVFGPDIAMPMSLSDLGNLRPFLETCDLPRRMAIAHAERHRAWMDTNIGRLVEFLDR